MDAIMQEYTPKVFDLVQELNDFERCFEFTATPSDDDERVHVEVRRTEGEAMFDEEIGWKEAYMFLHGFYLGRYLKP